MPALQSRVLDTLPVSYSDQLVALARDASMACLTDRSNADALWHAYIAALRAESAPFPKAILPAYFVSSAAPRDEEGFVAAAIAHAAFILELDLPVDVIDAFTLAHRGERSLTGDQLDALIAAKQEHVIWSALAWIEAEPFFRVVTFPLSFDTNVLEVWWPALRPTTHPALVHLPDGSWQEHCDESLGNEFWTGFADANGLRLGRGTLVMRLP